MSDDEEMLIGFKVVIRMVGVSKATINRRLERKQFPVPIKDGDDRNSRVLFSLREIRAYIEAKLRGRSPS